MKMIMGMNPALFDSLSEEYELSLNTEEERMKEHERVWEQLEKSVEGKKGVELVVMGVD